MKDRFCIKQTAKYNAAGLSQCNYNKRLLSLLLATVLMLSSSLQMKTEQAAAAEETVVRSWTETAVQSDKTAASDAEPEENLYAEIPVTSLQVSDLAAEVATDLDYTEWFYSEYEDCRYLCLPATADRSALKITYAAGGDQLYLNDTLVQSGVKTDLLNTADSFRVRVGTKECGMLHILQSDLGCVFLSTTHGGLDYVDGAKSRSDSGTVLMLNADQSVEYQGDLEKISGRGNSTWDYSKKKPYHIKLPEKQNLYGMGKAKKWELISNYLDHTMLRNASAMALSDATELVTLDYVFVDLYADGSYRGTYQLFERVQIQKHRVNIEDLEEATEKCNPKKLSEYPIVYSDGDKKSRVPNSYRYANIPNEPEDITGGYLVEFQLSGRYPACESGFVTSRGQCVEMRSPEYATKAQVLYMRQFMQELEDAIYSEDGCNSLGKHYSEYLDVDSVAFAFLLQEITANIDGSNTSFYFWKDSDAHGDGKLHAGPTWDFDLSMANFAKVVASHMACNPATLFTAYLPIEGSPDSAEFGWLGTLYRKEAFQERTVSLFYERLEPVLLDLFDTESETGIHAMGKALSASAAMNNAKWNMLGKNRPLGPVNGYTYEECLTYICVFLEKKHRFLNELWIPLKREQLLSDLQTAYKELPLERYDAEGLAEIEKLKSDCEASVAKHTVYAQMLAAYETTIEAFSQIPTKEIVGDFNDDQIVTLEDAMALLHYSAKQLAGFSIDLTPTQQRNGDVNDDGRVNVLDAMHALRLVAAKLIGKEYKLPVH